MGSEHYCLRWNNHQSNLLGVFSQLLHDESLVDVTLACSEGASIRAHKVVLSACSSYFQSLFVDHPSRHPIVILKDVRFTELRTLVEFMYKGEVNVEYCQLSALLKTAESLKVKGLAEMTELRATSGELATSLGATVERMDESGPQDLRAPELPSAPEPSLERTPVTPDHTIQSINCGQNDNMGINMSISSNKNGSSRGALCSPSSELRLAALSSLAAPPPARHSSPPVPLSVPARHEPIAGPSGMPPVQQVPLSLKKEVEWDRMPDDKNVGESSTDYRIPHETETYDGGSRGRGEEGDNRLYPCMYCGAAFPHQSKLTRHILSHSLETLKYRETVLGRPLGLPHMGPLSDSHYITVPPDDVPLDLEIGPVEPGNVVLCKFCGKSFPDVSSLISHLPVHTGDRPFKCEFCGKAFKLRHHMKDHCRVHTGERPFRCAMCGKTFSRSTILKAHEKTHFPKYVRKFLSPSPVDTEEESPHQ